MLLYKSVVLLIYQVLMLVGGFTVSHLALLLLNSAMSSQLLAVEYVLYICLLCIHILVVMISIILGNLSSRKC